MNKREDTAPDRSGHAGSWTSASTASRVCYCTALSTATGPTSPSHLTAAITASFGEVITGLASATAFTPSRLVGNGKCPSGAMAAGARARGVHPDAMTKVESPAAQFSVCGKSRFCVTGASGDI
jgi:hypothetical protein